MAESTPPARRSSAAWLPLLFVCALVLGGGLLLQRGVEAEIARLTALAASEPEAARRGAETMLRALVWGTAGFALGCAALFAWMGRLGLREERFPPSGFWSLGAPRVFVGAAARRRAIGLLVLAGALAPLGLATFFVGERLLAALTGAAPTP